MAPHMPIMAVGAHFWLLARTTSTIRALSATSTDVQARLWGVIAAVVCVLVG